MKNIALCANLHAMADSAILPLIDPDKLAEIKAKDSHPLFRAYAIGIEGDAEATQVGYGKRALHFFREIINQIHEKLAIGTRFFAGHGQTNAHDGRQTVGEVVGKAQIQDGEKLTDIAIAYIHPDHRDKVFDVASIEAENVEFTDAEGERAAVLSVGAITGIALGDRRFDRPAFSGATLRAAYQCFAGEKTMTLEDIQKAVKEGGYKPTDIFAAETIIALPEVTEHVAKAKQTEVEARRRIQEDLGAKLDKERADKEAALTAANALKADLTKTQAVKLFDALAAERKLPERQAKYVRARLEKAALTGADEAAVKAEIASLTDDALKDYQAVLDAEGVKPPDAPPLGTPSSDGNVPPADGDDPMLDPKKNPLFSGTEG